MKWIFSLAFSLSIAAHAQETLSPIKPGDPLPADRFVKLAKLVNPAIINVFTTQFVSRQAPMFNDPFFDLFFNNPRSRPPQPRNALGTGFVIREDGLVITNNHVIEGADEIKVQLYQDDENKFDAEVVGKDAQTDIALIRIKAKKKFSVIPLGTSKDVEVGEWVAAFGNPLGLGHTVSKGIISAKGRELDEINQFPFLQTDANINPGNSGGPLVNLQGYVVGVNTAIAGQGIGFAIDIDHVKAILPQLEKKGSIERGYIGVYLQDVTSEAAESMGLKVNRGAMVAQVLPESPAEKSGLLPYDVVTKVDDKKIQGSQDLIRAVGSVPVGKSMSLEVHRKDKSLSLKVTVGRHPENQVQSRTRGGKTYRGQKAPFDLGFTLEDYNATLANEYSLPKLRSPKPVIIQVDTGSPASLAGLAPGDIILDVNRVDVEKARDVLQNLRKGGLNVMRVLRQDRVAIVYLRSK